MKKIIISIALLALISVDAKAEFYIGGSYGKSISSEQTILVTETDNYSISPDSITEDSIVADFGDGVPIFAGDITETNIQYGAGSFISLFVGYKMPVNILRFEGELFKMSSGKDDKPATLSVSRGSIGRGDTDFDGISDTTSEPDVNNALSNRVGLYEMEVNAFMFNTYLDFEIDEIWTPYIGFGIGIAQTTLSSDNLHLFEDGTARYLNNSTGYNFGYQFLAGVDMRLTEDSPFSVGLQFRIFNQQDAFDGTSKYDTSFNALVANLRYEFGVDEEYLDVETQNFKYKNPPRNYYSQGNEKYDSLSY